jgi:tetratricopeptide (TPR) repeat protein
MRRVATTTSSTSTTASQLARAAGVPTRLLARFWQRGLIEPCDDAGSSHPFRAAANARTLGQLWRAGWSAARIARAWQLARTVVADHDEALHGLLASIGRTRLTVRTADGRLVEIGGQQVFDFAADDAVAALRSPAEWFELGVEAESRGRIADAVRAYERALPLGSADVHFNLGNCYLAQRRRRDAGAQFEATVAVAPLYAEAWNNLGVVRGRLGDRDGAVAALRQALAALPHYADAHYNLAEALAARGDVEGARRHWQAYVTYDPSSRWADRARRRLRRRGRA